MALFGSKVAVDLMIRGRIGEGWYDIDRKLKIPEGTTLGELIDIAARKGVPMREALESSPHLADTLMLNGDRCAVADNRDRVLVDGDQIYLLAPLAGG
jgi:molybdopterin converting factor small subunit